MLIIGFLSPSILAAEMNQNTTVVEAASEHEDEYDKIVNVADSSSVTNPSTWMPGASGIWVGSSTEESLYRFSDMTYPSPGEVHYGARMGIAYEFQFSRNQIMSGIAEFTMRLPTYNPGGLLWLSYMTIYELSEGATYRMVNNTGLGHPTAVFNPEITGGSTLKGYWQPDFNDTSTTDGNMCWTLEGRTYVHMVMPLFPDVRYLVFLNIIYAPDTNFALYLSPQDIVGDGAMNTTVALNNYDPTYDTFRTRFVTLPVDCGFSFDLQAGMGGGVYARRFSMEPGDEVVMEVHIDQATASIDAYHNLMIPFNSDDPIDVTVEVETFYEGPYAAIEDYTVYSWAYKDYILASSGHSSINDTITTVRSFTAEITLIFNTPASILLYFRATPGGEWLTSTVKGVHYYIPLWCDYQIATNAVVPSNDVSSGTPLNPIPDTLDPWQMLGSLVITMLFPGTVLVVSYFEYITSGDGIAGWVISKAGDILYAGAKYIYGIVKNAIDAAWNFLKQIGEFIWSIGEWLYQSLIWLAEQIVEYASYLLGIIIIGASLYLFFYPIQVQLKMWGFGLALAEGDFKGASREANGLMRELGKPVKLASKTFRTVKRTKRSYDKWQRGRERDRASRERAAEEAEE